MMKGIINWIFDSYKFFSKQEKAHYDADSNFCFLPEITHNINWCDECMLQTCIKSASRLL